MSNVVLDSIENLISFEGKRIRTSDGREIDVDLLSVKANCTFEDVYDSMLETALPGSKISIRQDIGARCDSYRNESIVVERLGEFNMVFMNDRVLPLLYPRVRAATPAEVEDALNLGVLNNQLRDDDVFTPSFVLWGVDGLGNFGSPFYPKDSLDGKGINYLAKSLAEQLVSHGENTLGFPYVIPVASLGIVGDKKSPLGINFKINDGASFFRGVDQLDIDRGYFVGTDKNGMPEMLEREPPGGYQLRAYHRSKSGPLTALTIHPGRGRFLISEREIMNHAAYHQRMMIARPAE